MSIVVFVARQAVSGWCNVEDRLNVTGLALDVRVRTAERVACIQGMIELHLGPSGADMAGFALLSEMPLVVVVFLVASDTLRGQLVGERVVAVARIALLLRVPAVEQEASITIVIKTGVVPTDRTMTIATLVAAATVMGVIFCMTAEAGRRRVGKRIVCVAIEARGSLVLANQGEAGCVVIKLDVEPVVGCMAVAALRAQRAGMRIVILVARKTVAGRVTVSLLGTMTVVALVLDMVTDQREVGKFVIERRRIQIDDLGIAAFVVGVAPGARGPAGATVLSMEAGLGLDVRSNVVMTIEA